MNFKNLNLIIGLIIAIFLAYIIPITIGSLIAVFLGAMYVGYMIEKNYKEGIFNGVILGVLYAIFAAIATSYIMNYHFESISELTIWILGLMILYVVCGVFGGIFGTFIKNLKILSFGKVVE